MQNLTKTLSGIFIQETFDLYLAFAVFVFLFESDNFRDTKSEYDMRHFTKDPNCFDSINNVFPLNVVSP